MKEYKYKINGNTYKVAIGDIDNNIAEVEVNGVPYKVELDKAKKPVTIINAPRPSAAPRTADGGKVNSKPAAKSGGAKKVVSPLPGSVVSIAVKVGDTVKAADTVAILEAMKWRTQSMPAMTELSNPSMSILVTQFSKAPF